MQSALKLQLRISDKEIQFVNGYPFRQSSVYPGSKVHASQISEISFDTFPYSLVINDKEIIFLEYNHRHKSALTEFAGRNNIPISTREDLWYWLCTPFLDTEFDADEKQRIISLLVQNGFEQQEIESIRRRIARVLWIDFLGGEWEYIGQFDYLRFRFFPGRKTYWWSMEIALRNYYSK